MIIGADVYPIILQGGLFKRPQGAPVAQETVLGWIVTGLMSRSNQTQYQVHAMALDPVVEDSEDLSNLELSRRLQTQWEVESIPKEKPLTKEESECQELFETTYSRDQDGRFVVRLPFRFKPQFKNSRKIALSQIYKLKQKFATNRE